MTPYAQRGRNILRMSRRTSATVNNKQVKIRRVSRDVYIDNGESINRTEQRSGQHQDTTALPADNIYFNRTTSRQKVFSNGNTAEIDDTLQASAITAVGINITGQPCHR